MNFDFVTDFSLNSSGLNHITDFIKKDTDSPTLNVLRKSVNKQTKETKSANNPFANAEKDPNKGLSTDDLKEISEDKINESLSDLTDDDYEDFGEIGIELLDFAMDKIFIMLGRIPAENSSLMDKKKERLKIITGRLFKKWGVKFSLEMLGVFLLIGYINMRWSKSEKQDKTEGSSKVIKMKPQKVTNFEKKQTKKETKKEDSKKVNKETKRKGLLNIAN